MDGRAGLRCAARAVALAWLAGAAACSHMPWHHRPPPAPAPVHELDISGAGADANTADAFPQYWKRNTLLVDLSAARGSGSIELRPASGAAWPVRLAFRVTPGAIGALEVSAAQHTRLPINPSGSRPIDLELDPGIYTPQSEKMTVSWGAESAPAP
jgi:hypothetical protein